MSDLNKSDLEKLIKLLNKIITKYPNDENIELMKADLSKAKELLKLKG
jgi:hypothetical protein